MRDLANNLKAVQAVAPAVVSATNTSAALDTLGFGSAMVVIETGAVAGAGDFTAKLQHSDTTTSGEFVDVPEADLVGTLPATLEADSTYRQGYIGYHRYVRTVLTKNSGTSIAASATLIMGRPAEAPVAA